MSTPSACGTPPTAYLPPPPPPPGYAYPNQYASLLSRFGAAVIDLIILGLITAVIALPLGLLAAASTLAYGTMPWFVAVLFGPFTLLLILLWLGYFTYFESTTGQTLGKRALDLRVVDLTTGRPPTLGKALLRTVARVVDWLPALYIVGFIVAYATPRRQRIGDLLADTVVLRV